MNSNGKYFKLPKSIIAKMRKVRSYGEKSKLYNYLWNVVEKSLHNSIETIPVLNEDIEKFHFELTKNEENHYFDFLWRAEIKGNIHTILIDPDFSVRRRMQNFYTFEDDMDFIVTFLYFTSKTLNIPFIVVSDVIFETMVETKITNAVPTSNEFVKTVSISLR
jgi:hypothetical protein